MPVVQQQFMTELEVAAYLGIKPATLQKWRADRKHGLPYIRLGGAIRYRRSDVDQWLKERTVKD